MKDGTVYFSIDRDGWTKKLQLCINDEGEGGYRIAGPKYNGSSKTLLIHILSERDVAELRECLDRVAASQENAS